MLWRHSQLGDFTTFHGQPWVTSRKVGWSNHSQLSHLLPEQIEGKGKALGGERQKVVVEGGLSVTTSPPRFTTDPLILLPLIA